MRKQHPKKTPIRCAISKGTCLKSSSGFKGRVETFKPFYIASFYICIYIYKTNAVSLKRCTELLFYLLYPHGNSHDVWIETQSLTSLQNLVISSEVEIEISLSVTSWSKRSPMSSSVFKRSLDFAYPASDRSMVHHLSGVEHAIHAYQKQRPSGGMEQICFLTSVGVSLFL